MRLVFYGSAMEVGRNCIEVDDKYLLDCGIKFTEEGTEYPLTRDVAKIKAVFLSHPHLDHAGALPMFNHLGLNCPIYCNSMIADIAKVLLKDSYHVETIEKQHPEYRKENITNVLSMMRNMRYDKEYSENGCKFKLLYSGHIPGSTSFLLEHEGKRLVFTGDINCGDTRLMGKAIYKEDNVDAMICEATYGDREHPPRKEVENAFLSKISEVTEKGGSVLIPVFALGRAQEIMLVLKEKKFNVPIYLDGMSKKITQIMLKRPGFVKNNEELAEAYKRITPVEGPKMRKELAKSQGIVITTSGMLDGGPAIDYLKYYCHDPKNAILLTGYQTENCNGRLLLEQRKVYIDGIRHKVKSFVEKYDFSAHAGRKELVEHIRRNNPKTLILHHGEEGALESLRKEFENEMKVYVPHLGDKIEV
jgi:putative mRNA 3-end processing factor